jgi:hypothetical protein
MRAAAKPRWRSLQQTGELLGVKTGEGFYKY